MPFLCQRERQKQTACGFFPNSITVCLILQSRIQKWSLSRTSAVNVSNLLCAVNCIMLLLWSCILPQGLFMLYGGFQIYFFFSCNTCSLFSLSTNSLFYAVFFGKGTFFFVRCHIFPLQFSDSPSCIAVIFLNMQIFHPLSSVLFIPLLPLLHNYVRHVQ